jgi:hypothetical protein
MSTPPSASPVNAHSSELPIPMVVKVSVRSSVEYLKHQLEYLSHTPGLTHSSRIHSTIHLDCKRQPAPQQMYFTYQHESITSRHQVILHRAYIKHEVDRFWVDPAGTTPADFELALQITTNVLKYLDWCGNLNLVTLVDLCRTDLNDMVDLPLGWSARLVFTAAAYSRALRSRRL